MFEFSFKVVKPKAETVPVTAKSQITVEQTPHTFKQWNKKFILHEN